MPDAAFAQNYLAVGAVLFALGLVGFVVRRNMIVMFLCVEMMLQGVSLSLVAWSGYHHDWGGQMLVLFVVAVAACEAAIALVLVLVLFKRSGRLDIALWQELRDPGLRPYVDREIPEEGAAEPVWPTLTPAGHEPPVDQQEVTHRSRV